MISLKWQYAEDSDDEWEDIRAFDKEHAAEKLAEIHHGEDPDLTEFEYTIANEDLSDKMIFKVILEYDISFSATEKD